MVPLGHFLQDEISLEQEELLGSLEVPQEVMRTRQQKDRKILQNKDFFRVL